MYFQDGEWKKNLSPFLVDKDDIIFVFVVKLVLVHMTRRAFNMTRVDQKYAGCPHYLST